MQYSHQDRRARSLVDLYYAPVGDPALGPVAYPHRASAMEIPQATLAITGKTHRTSCTT